MRLSLRSVLLSFIGLVAAQSTVTNLETFPTIIPANSTIPATIPTAPGIVRTSPLVVPTGTEITSFQFNFTVAPGPVMTSRMNRTTASVNTTATGTVGVTPSVASSTSTSRGYRVGGSLGAVLLAFVGILRTI